MNKSNKKLPGLSVVFYVLTSILALYAVWALICCHSYISKLVASGQLTTNGNEFTISSYYMTNCIQYIFYSAMFFFFGKLYSSVTNKVEQSIEGPPIDEKMPSTIFEPEESDDNDDFSEWKSPL